MTSTFFSILLHDASKLLRPSPVTILPSSTSAPASPYESLLPPNHEYAELSKERETLNDFYSSLGPDFEERLLTLSKGQAIKSDMEEVVRD